MDIGALSTSPDWGTLPDWLAAIGTVSAVAWALHLGRQDGNRLDEERRDAKKEREEAAADRELFRKQQAAEAEVQRRKLASKVSLVVEPFRDDVGDRKLLWTVHNGGDEPISMVSVVRRAVDADDTSGDAKTRVCKTWTGIEAGGDRSHTMFIRDESYMAQGEVQFTDGEGRRWQRMEFGALRPMSPDDPQALLFVPLQR